MIDLPLARALGVRRCAGSPRPADPGGAAAHRRRLPSCRRSRRRNSCRRARACPKTVPLHADGGTPSLANSTEPVEVPQKARRNARAPRESSPSGRSSPSLAEQHSSSAGWVPQARISSVGDEAANGRPQRARCVAPQAPGSSGGVSIWPRSAAMSAAEAARSSRGSRSTRATSAIGGSGWHRSDRLSGGARARAYGRGDPDRVRPPQGGTLPALQPGAAQGPDLAGTDGSAPHDRAGRQRVPVRTAGHRHECAARFRHRSWRACPDFRFRRQGRRTGD